MFHPQRLRLRIILLECDLKTVIKIKCPTIAVEPAWRIPSLNFPILNLYFYSIIVRPFFNQ